MSAGVMVLKLYAKRARTALEELDAAIAKRQWGAAKRASIRLYEASNEADWQTGFLVEREEEEVR